MRRNINVKYVKYAKYNDYIQLLKTMSKIIKNAGRTFAIRLQFAKVK